MFIGGNMILQAKTTEIKYLSNGIKHNFLKIGKLLIEVRDRKLYLDKYTDFTSYLESEEFTFCKRTAYNMMKSYETFGVQQVAQINLRTLIQLVYVPDREVREALAEEAKTVSPKDINTFKKKVERAAKRTDQDLETPIDSLKDKCKRQLNDLIRDVQSTRAMLNSLRDRIEKVILFSTKFEHEREIKDLKAILIREWEGCFSGKRS